MLSDYSSIICSSDLVVNYFFDIGKTGADDLIVFEIIGIFEESIVDPVFQFLHTVATDLFGNGVLIQVHKAGEFKQRSAPKFFLPFFFCDGWDSGDKVGNCCRGMGVAGAHIVEQAIVVGAGISKTADGVHNFGIQGDSIGVFSVIELDEFDQSMKTDNFHKNPHRAVRGQDTRSGRGDAGAAAMKDKTQLEIFVDQFAGEDGVGFFFDTVSDGWVFGKKFVADTISILVGVALYGGYDFDFQRVFDVNAHRKYMGTEMHIQSR